MEYTAKTSHYSSISNFINKTWLFLYLLSLFAYAPFLFYFICIKNGICGILILAITPKPLTIKGETKWHK